MSIRIAVIGASHWHSLYDAAYLKQLGQMSDVQIVGLHDDDGAVVAQRAAAIGGVPAYTDIGSMLAAQRPDFVLALPRHDRMAQVAHALLDRRLPFLMEKPMGLDAEEVRGVAARAEEQRAFVAVPFPMRYSPFVRQARGMLAEQRFGTLSHVYIRMNRFSSARYVAWNSAWMLDPQASGGGCLRNLGAHGFDVFLLLTGETAVVTAAQASTRALDQCVEDFATVLLRTPSGVLGTLEVGNAYPRQTTEGHPAPPTRDRLLDGADGEWKVVGRRALLASKDGVMRVVTADGEQSMPGEPARSPSFDVLRDALDAWQRGDPPPVSVHDCLRSVELIDQAYRMAA